MTNSRWQQIKELYEAAAKLDPSERAPFLDKACDGDDALRREIDSLLAYEKEAEGFIEVPALEAAAKALAQDATLFGVGLGETISQYRILEKLGSGGMGVVYKAEDIKLHRFVALKFLSEDIVADQQALERFQREARAIAALDHPNICTIHNVEDHKGQPFIVMQWLDGQTLKQRLDGTPLPVRELLDLAIQITDALEKVHANDIIHRDIKPANIFITKQGQAKILDFGLAKIQANPKIGIGSAKHLTDSGITLGTLGYMSPEQVLGQSMDHRTDLFSWGAVLYEMATGQAAFKGKTAVAPLDQILRRRPMQPSALNPELPSGLEQIIEKLLEKVPEHRYQNATELKAALLEIQAATTANAGEVSRTPFSARRTFATFLTGAAAVVLAIAGIAWWAASNPELRFDQRDTVMLGAIQNATDDAALEGTIEETLRIGLEQSRHVDVLSKPRVRQALIRMQKNEAETLGDEIAREVCQREGAKILISGTISRTGNAYVLAVRLVDCITGDPLRTLSESVDSRTEILSAVTSMTKDLRLQLGESLRSVTESSRQLAQVTTSSLEALKFFTDGNALWTKGRFEDARTLYRRAIELDSGFARAYASLGTSYYANNAGIDDRTAAQYFQEALKQLDRVTERERLEILQLYNTSLRKYPTALSYARLLVDAYPKVDSYRSNVARILQNLGQYKDAIPEYEQAFRLNPNSADALINIAICYSGLGQSDQAAAYYKKAFALAPEMELDPIRNHQYGWALLSTGQETQARAVFDKMLSKSGIQKARGHRSLGILALYRGQFEEARRQIEEAGRLHEFNKEYDSAARDLLYLGEALILVGQLQAGVDYIDRAALWIDTEGFPGWLIVQMSMAYSRSGKIGRARKLLDLGKMRVAPESSQDLSTVLLAETALSLAQKVSEEPLEQIRRALALNLDPFAAELALARGLAQNGRRNEAIEVYERVTSRFPPAWQSQVEWVLAHRDLSQLYAATGQTDKARASYQKMLNLWRDADPEILSRLERND